MNYETRENRETGKHDCSEPPFRFQNSVLAGVLAVGLVGFSSAWAQEGTARPEGGLPAWAVNQVAEYAALNAFAEAALAKFTDTDTGKPCCEFHHGNADDVVEGVSTWDRFVVLAGSEKVRGGMAKLWQYIYDELVRTGDFVDGFYVKGYDAEHTGELYQMLHALLELDPGNAKLAEANRKIADVIIDRCYNPETRLCHHAVLSTSGGANRKDNPFVDEIMNGLYILNAFRAWMTTGDEKYRRWALEYGGKWNELAAENKGVLPFAADSKTGKMLPEWWGNSSFSYKVYGVITPARELQGWAPAMVLMDGGDARHLSGVIGTLDAMFASRADGLPNTTVDETGWSRGKGSWFVPKLLDRAYACSFDPALRRRIKSYYEAAKARKEIDKDAAAEESFLRWHLFTYFGEFDEQWAADLFAKGASVYKSRLAKLNQMTVLPKTGDEITEQVMCRPQELSLVDGGFWGDYDNFRAGAPALSPVRYWRADGKCGLPSGVAALVRSVSPEGVELWLCNTADAPAELRITGGFYGQHRIERVRWLSGAVVDLKRGLAPVMSLTLPPSREVRLFLGMTRYAFPPTLTPNTRARGSDGS